VPNLGEKWNYIGNLHPVSILSTSKMSMKTRKKARKTYWLSWSGKLHCISLHTLRSLIEGTEGYTRLLIFRKFSILPAVIWVYLFINLQENFQLPCFFTYTNKKNPSYLLEPAQIINPKTRGLLGSFFSEKWSLQYQIFFQVKYFIWKLRCSANFWHLDQCF
jgi:hypothetical protein